MVLVVTFLALASASIAGTPPPSGLSADKGANALRFENFAVPAEIISHPAQPVLNSPFAREYRTVLSRAAAQGPDFAGHYTIAIWGCGTSCIGLAIVDAKTGHVFFDRTLLSVAYDNGDRAPGADCSPPPGYDVLNFRANSRLFIVAGAPNEDEARDGVAFYEWSGESLKLLRFVPATDACSAPLD